MKHETIVHNEFATYEPEVLLYGRWNGDTNIIEPYIYTNWQEETLSWKQGCYLHSGLAGLMANLKVKGPDAEKLMADTFVNNFRLEKFPIGSCKQTIACAPTGNIAMNGVSLRIAEDEFDTYCLDPHVPMQIHSGKYDVEEYDVEYNKDFVFQIAGPTSLQVVENAIEADIHDLKFMRFTSASILGHPVRVLRMGMGGTLSYEIHGDAEHTLEIYDHLVKIGQDYGLKRLGKLAYMCNHTENGFPQTGTHMMVAFAEDPEIQKYLGFDVPVEPADSGDEDFGWAVDTTKTELHGSLADMGQAAYYCNPIELGWERLIDWSKDFVGKEALEKIRDNPATGKICTLEWNPQDILQIYAAYFDDEPGIPDRFQLPQDYYWSCGGNLADKVLDEQGNMIGKSAGFVYTCYTKTAISLGMIDPNYCTEGTEVTVLWGSPGTRQFKIRARVARYPYLQLPTNRDYDTSTIPRYPEK